MGRKKINISKITDERNRHVCSINSIIIIIFDFLMLVNNFYR